MATGREAQVFACSLARDGAAGIEDTGDYGGVHFWHIAFQQLRAIHHWDASHADIVFDGDSLPLKNALVGPFDLRLPIPGIERILIGSRTIARSARIFHRQLRLWQLVEAIIRGDGSGHESAERGGIFRGQRHAEGPGNFQNLVDGGQSYRHGSSSQRNSRDQKRFSVRESLAIGQTGVMCITVKKQGSLAWFLKFDLRSRNPFPRTRLGEVMGSLQVHPKFG